MKASTSTRAWIAKLLILGAVAIFVVLGIAWITVRLCFPAFIMSSFSMENTVLRGDTVLVDRLATWRGRLPARGDITAFHFPPDRREIYLHRIVGLPGDRLKIRNKHLYRDGVAVPEPYAQHATAYMDPYRDNFPNMPDMPLRPEVVDMLENHVANGELVVPEGHYFVMGDNRDDAADSRYFGFVQRSDIIGRAILIIVSRDPKRRWTVPR
jgi:signal peptidase I